MFFRLVRPFKNSYPDPGNPARFLECFQGMVSFVQDMAQKHQVERIVRVGNGFGWGLSKMPLGDVALSRR
jgi:hypothetical protein